MVLMLISSPFGCFPTELHSSREPPPSGDGEEQPPATSFGKQQELRALLDLCQRIKQQRATGIPTKKV
jgi:hypothetical protein